MNALAERFAAQGVGLERNGPKAVREFREALG